jgi:ribonuclease Z
MRGMKQIPRSAAACLVVCLTLAAGSCSAPSVAGGPIEVTLLGTGHPGPSMERFGPGILVRAADQVLLFDAGRGGIQRLTQLGVSYREIDAVFLTHLHSDHVVGLPDLWLTGWLVSGRDMPLSVFGPKGTKHLAEHLKEAFEFDIGIRLVDERLPPDGAKLEVREVEGGFVYKKGNVRVTAFFVDHKPISPALGYRIDYGGHAVALSGDTRFSTGLIQAAAGVDLLVHEVADAREGLTERYPSLGRVIAHHTTASEAGKVFEKVKPKLAVYSHIVLSGITESELVNRTRQTYTGPLVVGRDLMSFVVGENVTVQEP